MKSSSSFTKRVLGHFRLVGLAFILLLGSVMTTLRLIFLPHRDFSQIPWIMGSFIVGAVLLSFWIRTSRGD